MSYKLYAAFNNHTLLILLRHGLTLLEEGFNLYKIVRKDEDCSLIMVVKVVIMKMTLTKLFMVTLFISMIIFFQTKDQLT